MGVSVSVGLDGHLVATHDGGPLLIKGPKERKYQETRLLTAVSRQAPPVGFHLRRIKYDVHLAVRWPYAVDVSAAACASERGEVDAAAF